MSRAKLYLRKRSSRPSSTPRLRKPCPLTGEAQQSKQTGPSLEEFTREVVRALDTLPQEIVEKLANVAVTIEDCPSAEVLAEKGIANPNELFGLYRGVPRPWRSVFATLVEFPDKFEIYYQPILHSGLRPREMRELIRRVVVHEVAHHFGMSDQQLRALGY
ncbi:MAG: metallopeptidase family protein [Deltaproteobacteria bacterium]|nr:metallopeptidase family protein [Deltaproteobacteria bacterium]